MEQIIRALEQIRSLPGAQVDVNVGQGREPVLRQLLQRGVPPGREATYLIQHMNEMNAMLSELGESITPHTLPDDYRFFLDYCGGLAIDTPVYRLTIYGLGPMMNDWYTDVLMYNTAEGDDALQNNTRGLIIGYLRTNEVNRRIDFRIDVGGVVQKNAVIAIGPGQGSGSHPLSFDEDIREWKVSASSFATWLEQIAETGGSLGYV